MKAALITIGDEILNGQIVDSNSAWMARRLAALQLPVVRITSVADTRGSIAEALQRASEWADIIIVTGGLGPTKDDVTKEALASYFGTELVRNEAVLAHVKNLFSRLGSVDMPVANVRQADVPAGAVILFNDVGTAPGLWMEHRGRHYVFLPGVPFEMEYLMENRVIPKLERFAIQDVVHNAYLLVVGIGESHLAERIADIEAHLPPHIRLAYLPKIGTVTLRLTAQGTDAGRLRLDCERISAALQERLGQAVAALEDISLEQAIIERLKQQGRSLSTAESCTGGRISSLLTTVPGASAVFHGSAVVYSNAAKTDILDVEPEIIAKFGAVSGETVRRMAENAKRKFQTDYAIATSGIAGPGGGTAKKPVGTVWVALAGPQETVEQAFHFQNDRRINIERSAAAALRMLFEKLRA